MGSPEIGGKLGVEEREERGEGEAEANGGRENQEPGQSKTKTERTRPGPRATHSQAQRETQVRDEEAEQGVCLGPRMRGRMGPPGLWRCGSAHRSTPVPGLHPLTHRGKSGFGFCEL